MGQFNNYAELSALKQSSPSNRLLKICTYDAVLGQEWGNLIILLNQVLSNNRLLKICAYDAVLGQEWGNLIILLN